MHTSWRDSSTPFVGDRSDEREPRVEGDTGMISFLDKDNRPFTLTKSDGHIYLNDLQTIHNNFSIEPVVFDVAEESDGTRRLLDLVVAFYIFSKLKSSR